MRTSMFHGVGILLLCAGAAGACGGNPPATPTGPTVPLDPLVGHYSLTVTAGPACRTLPEIARSRTYTASIESRGADNYVVTLTDGTFLADEQIGERTFISHCSSSYGLGCNQFTASREGDQVRFRMAPNNERFDDEFAGNGGSVVELIPPDNNRLGIQGTGLGRLDGTSIEASVDGRVWYCPARYSSFDEECASCDHANLAMTFTRR